MLNFRGDRIHYGLDVGTQKRKTGECGDRNETEDETVFSKALALVVGKSGFDCVEHESNLQEV